MLDTNKKIGLVLSGGGGKGAYQIGFWKALKELKLDKNIIAISGTSVGALNSLLIANNDLNIGIKLWKELNQNQVMQFNYIDLVNIIINVFSSSKTKNFSEFFKTLITQYFQKGIFRRERIEEILDNNIDLKKIINSNIKIYSTAVNIEEFKVRYFCLNDHLENEVKKIVLASSAIPGVYKNIQINNCDYMDGGIPEIGDNVPIKPILEIGCDIVIVVYLSKSEEHSLKNSLYHQNNNFSVCHISSDNDLGNFFNGTLNFTPEKINELIDLGYKESLTKLKEFFSNKHNLSVNVKVKNNNEQDYYQEIFDNILKVFNKY